MYDTAQINSVYNDLANKVKTDLDEQFNKGRIKGTDYATVYSNLMNTILQLSFTAPLRDEQVKDTQEGIKLKQSQEALYNAQTEVAERQKQSYDDSIRLKLFKAQMDTWGIMFSSGMLETKPNVIKNDEVSSLYNDIKNHIRN